MNKNELERICSTGGKDEKRIKYVGCKIWKEENTLKT